jgi:predicted nucleic acid-binding Zn ribbon protein
VADTSHPQAQCGARLFLGDDYGDNTCTHRCQMVEGHEGKHTEIFPRSAGGFVRVEWDADEREPCLVCKKIVDRDRSTCSNECSEIVDKWTEADWAKLDTAAANPAIDETEAP